MGKKRDQQLPDWFDLGKYALAGSLDLAGWLYQFQVRNAIYQHTEPSDWQNHDLLSVIREKGLVPVDPKDPFGDQVGLVSFLRGTSEKIPEDRLAVRIPSIRRCFQSFASASGLSESQVIDLSRQSTQSIGHSLKDVFLLPDQLGKTMSWKGSPHNPLIEIDLSFPNATIEAHFKIILDRLRLEDNSDWRRHFSASPDDWTQDKVLQFLDLHYWGVEVGKTLNRAQILRLLYPSDEDRQDTSYFRKRKEPEFIRLISDDYLRKLETIVAEGL